MNTKLAHSDCRTRPSGQLFHSRPVSRPISDSSQPCARVPRQSHPGAVHRKRRPDLDLPVWIRHRDLRSRCLRRRSPAFWVFPFLLKAGVPYNPLALVSIENLIFCILWSCYFYGGVTSPTLAWVLDDSVAGILLSGLVEHASPYRTWRCSRRIWRYSAASIRFVRIDDKLPVDAMQGLGLVSTDAASIYVAMMALYYAKVQAAQGELETRCAALATAALRAATEEAERRRPRRRNFWPK